MGDRVAPRFDDSKLMEDFLRRENAAMHRPAMLYEPPLPLDPSLTVFGNAPPHGVVFIDPRAFFQASVEGYRFWVAQMLAQHPMINVQLRMSITLAKNEDRATFWLQPRGLTSFQRSDSKREINRKLLEAFEMVMEDLARFTENGSGFHVERVDKTYMYATPYEPLTAGSRFPIPKKLTSRRAVIDVYKGEAEADDCCLKWALRACLHRVEKNPERKAKYPGNGQDGLNYDGLSFPTPWTQIEVLEKNNPHIAVNLFLYNNKEDNISTMRQSPRRGGNIKVVDLLMLTNEETDKHHYVWIKNMSRLIRRQANSNNQVFVCGNCLSVFKTKEKQERHVPDCLRNSQNGAKPIRLEFPEAGTPQAILKFARHGRKRRVPWVVYMDFECLLAEPKNNTGLGNHSIIEADHLVCGASFLAVGPDSTLPLFIHRGPDAADKLLHTLADAGKEMRRQMFAVANRQQKNMSFADWRAYGAATDCALCGEELLHHDERDQVEYFSWATGRPLGKVHKYTKAPSSRKSCYREMLTKEWEQLNEAPGDVDFHSLPPRAKPTRVGYVPPENEDNCAYCNRPLLQACFREAHLSFDDLGKFAGAVHSRCRSKPAHLQEIPVFIHNSRGYDTHLLMQAISQVQMPDAQHKLTCIPNNREKLLTFSWNGFGFKDSYQHMAAPLDALVKSALGPPDDPCVNLPLLREVFGRPVPLLARKGVYPYERMRAWEDFDLPQLPPIEDFYSSLKVEGVKEADYAHAQQVWKEFGCQNMGDYHDLYLKSDVALLADVYESHRELCLETYGLDPAHYITSPGLSWDALLKHTGVELELLTDVNKYLFIEKGLRGGISRVSRRQTTANVPGTAEYDPTRPNEHILYLDANNLYGYAMCQPLPVSGFRWENVANMTAETIMGWKDDGPVGRILEVDLDYPEELHDLHRDYPLAPELDTAEFDEYSRSQRRFIRRGMKIRRLLLTLKPKEKYVLHQANLRLYLRLGLKLRRVHRCLRFEQKAWMAPYIQLNTDLRTKAKSDFESNFFKLMNNSVFGKTMENLRRRTKVYIERLDPEITKLLKEGRSLEETLKEMRERGLGSLRVSKLIRSPLYVASTIVCEGLILIQHRPEKVRIDKPVFTGMCVLDLSKTLMYRYFYDHLKAVYGERCRLSYTDTDSFILKITTNDLVADMKPHLEEWYDTSNYPKDHPLYSAERKKKVGFMKDEMGGKTILELIALSAKMYSILREDGGNEKKAKGVNKGVTKHRLSHEQYRQANNSGASVQKEMRRFRSHKHQLYTECVNKKALSWLDLKSHVTADNEVIPFGHGRIQDFKMAEQILESLLEGLPIAAPPQ